MVGSDVGQYVPMPVAKHSKSHPTTIRDIRVIRGRTDPSPGPAHSNATFLIVALHGEPEGRADDALNPGCETGELGWAAFLARTSMVLCRVWLIGVGC